MSASQPPAAMSKYPDAHELLSAISAMSGVQLRDTVKSCNSIPGVKMNISGTKVEQIQKLRNQLYDSVNSATSMKYNQLRHQVYLNARPDSFTRSPNYALYINSKNTGIVSPELGKGPSGTAYYYGSTAGAAPPTGPASAASSTYPGWKPPERPANGVPANKYPSSSSSSSFYSKSQVPASKPIPTTAPRGPPTFQSSPFYSIKEFIGRPITLLENYGSEKKTMVLALTLNAAQVALLQGSSESGVAYEVKLFCAKQIIFDQSCFIPPRSTANVEFPTSCEVRVNSQPLTVNLKGTKKTAAKVSPPNLNKDGKLTIMTAAMNKIDIVYTNASTKYAVYAALCSVTSADVLAKRVRSGKFRTKDEVLAGKKKAAEDDDIQAGSSTLSLRCPLTYMRMKSPCRSSNCAHTQCFDAESFFTMMQQTPTWICPVCNNVLNPELLIIDGYVDEILSTVPDSQDNVIVEPDGSWHTSDGKHTSSGKPLAPKSNQMSHEIIDSDDEDDRPITKSKGKERETPNNASESAVKRNVVVLDDESSPARLTASLNSSRPTSSSTTATTTRPRSSVASSEVIDLTLDSDDDDIPPRPAKRSRTGPNGSSNAATSSSVAGTNGVRSSTFSGVQPTNDHSTPSSGTANGNSTAAAVNGTEKAGASGNDDPAMVLVHGRLINLDTDPNLQGWSRQELLDHDQELLKSLIHNPETDP